MSLAGIDIGTTGCKCTIYSIDGRLISESYTEYEIQNGEEHELDPYMVWEKTKIVLKEASTNVERIIAIGITSFGEAAILLNEEGEPLLNSLLYANPKGEEQCQHLIRKLGKEYIIKTTGLNPSHMYSISKLMWLNKFEAEKFSQCANIHLFEDYIVYKLCGVRQIDYSLASRTMAYDINTLKWDDQILDFAGINKSHLPKTVPIGSIAGQINSVIANELGINEDALIVSGCHDQIAAAIGTGTYKKNCAVDSTGTVECITPVFDRSIDLRKLSENSYAVVPFIYDKYVTYAFSLTGGALLKWYRDQLMDVEADMIEKGGKIAYNVFNDSVDDTKPSGLLVLPHFSGAATPYMDKDSKGAIIGLTTNTTKAELYQGLMEGVTFDMKVNVERLEDAGIYIDKLRATGGGAVSSIWLQMKADILNRPIISLGAAQSGTLGCIMLAGLACNVYDSIEEAENIFVKEENIYYPQKNKHHLYMNYYTKYKKMYKSVKTVID